MACDPSTTISAEDIRGLKADITTIDTVVESQELTTTTKNGTVIDTLAGRLLQLGFLPPVVYAAGIVFTDQSDLVKTIDRDGIVYAPLPSALPFTTSGTWVGDDENNFYVIQQEIQTRVASAAALRAVPAGSTDWVEIQGYYGIGTPGGGAAWYDAASTDPDDGGSTFLPNGHSGPGRYKKLLGCEVSIHDFGSRVDDTTLDTATNQACADYCGANKRVLVYPDGTSYQDTVILNNVLPTGCGEDISFVRGMPGRDVFQYLDPGATGWVRPNRLRSSGLTVLVDFSVDASVEGSGAYERCDYYGQPVGNAAFSFPSVSDSALSAPSPLRLGWENIHIFETGTLSNNGNNTVAFYWGVASYGAFLKKVQQQGLSFGWVDGPVSARYITTVDTVGDAVTFNGPALADNDAVTLLGEAGTPPGGITARTQLYYVINSTGNTCQLSLTLGGAAVPISSAGTGVFWLCKASSSYLEYAPDQNTFLHVDGLCRKINFSLCNQAYTSFTDCSSYVNQVGFRLLNYESVNRAFGTNLVLSGNYSEGSTDGGFTGNSLYNEWNNCQIDQYWLTGGASTAVIGGSRNKIDYFFTRNLISVGGDKNKVNFYSDERDRVTVTGSNPEVSFYNSWGGETRPTVPQIYDEKTQINRGAFESDWLETNPSSRYLSKRETFISGTQVVGFGATNANMEFLNDDYTLELNGYIRVAAAFFAAAVDIRSRSGVSSAQDMIVGEYVPAAKCRLHIKLRSDVVQAETIQLRALDPSTAIASTSITHTIGWQVITFDGDLSSFTGRALQITMDGVAASAYRDIAWIKFVPFMESVLAHAIELVPTTVASLPSASVLAVGAKAFVTDSTAATFGATAAGGGSNAVPVYSDGTNWLVG